MFLKKQKTMWIYIIYTACSKYEVVTTRLNVSSFYSKAFSAIAWNNDELQRNLKRNIFIV